MLRNGPSIVPIGGLIGGLIRGLVGGFMDRVKADEASSNQGIKLSRNNSLAVFLVSWLTVGLIFGPPIGLIFGPVGGLIAGLFGGLNRGGSAVIKHYALRLTLWRNEYMPLNLVALLDHCARLILLKKVGGGYIFIHRMLLEYFAELTPQSKRLEVGSKTSK
jgi:eukaryotic-like serine/threonine-protein kinase